MMLHDNYKNYTGFTLIELLIVIAILGILAAIAIPQYQGQQATAKVNASKDNHRSVVNLLMGSYANCSAGIASITLGTASVSCSSSSSTFASEIKTYFDAQNLKNPYTFASAITIGAAGSTDGQTYLTVSGVTTTITTVASSSESLTSVIVKE